MRNHAALSVPKKSATENASRYSEEEHLWEDIIRSATFIYETQRLFLDEFKLLEWIPRAPGMYYTPPAKSFRHHAHDFLVDDNSSIFDPYGKAQMVFGGIGCQRLAIKNVAGNPLKFLSATSSGIAHKGFIIALRPETYRQIAPLISNNGCAVCNLEGQILSWQTEDNLPLYAAVNIPSMYLLVERVSLAKTSEIKPGQLDVTAAVAFRGKVDERESNYLTFSHFDPSIPDDLIECINWIKESYVERRYAGRVITDFDEIVPHFPYEQFRTALPIKVVMDPNLSPQRISAFVKVLEDFQVDAERLKIHLEKLVINELKMSSSISINGDGNVVGNNNRVVTSIHKGLTGQKDLRELGEAFALLRGEILNMESVPEKVKNQAVRAIEDAEDEVADKKPVPETIESGLRRAKGLLETSGEVYDSAVGWGKRLYDLGNILGRVVPVAAPIIARIFSG